MYGCLSSVAQHILCAHRQADCLEHWRIARAGFPGQHAQPVRATSSRQLCCATQLAARPMRVLSKPAMCSLHSPCAALTPPPCPALPLQELCPGFKGSLRDYQVKGVKWLISLWSNGLNGILADQMGLGKTVSWSAWQSDRGYSAAGGLPAGACWRVHGSARNAQTAVCPAACSPPTRLPPLTRPPTHPPPLHPPHIPLQVQTIGFLCHLRNSGHINGPYLVLGPLSTLTNWVSEFERWAPDFPVVLYHGNKAERQAIRSKHMPTGERGCVCAWFGQLAHALLCPAQVGSRGRGARSSISFGGVCGAPAAASRLPLPALPTHQSAISSLSPCRRAHRRQVPRGGHQLRDPAGRHQGHGQVPLEVHRGGRGTGEAVQMRYRGRTGAVRQCKGRRRMGGLQLACSTVTSLRWLAHTPVLCSCFLPPPPPVALLSSRRATA